MGRYVLLDSWWYEHGPTFDGVKRWDADPSVFPDGVAAVYDRTGWLVQVSTFATAESSFACSIIRNNNNQNFT